MNIQNTVTHSELGDTIDDRSCRSAHTLHELPDTPNCPARVSQGWYHADTPVLGNTRKIAFVEYTEPTSSIGTVFNLQQCQKTTINSLHVYDQNTRILISQQDVFSDRFTEPWTIPTKRTTTRGDARIYANTVLLKPQWKLIRLIANISKHAVPSELFNVKIGPTCTHVSCMPESRDGLTVPSDQRHARRRAMARFWESLQKKSWRVSCTERCFAMTSSFSCDYEMFIYRNRGVACRESQSWVWCMGVALNECVCSDVIVVSRRAAGR